MGLYKRVSLLFAVLVVASFAFAASASAATILSTTVEPTQAGSSASPQPVNTAVNTTFDTSGGAALGAVSTLVQTFPAELVNKIPLGAAQNASNSCPSTSYAGTSPPATPVDPTTVCPAGSILGTGFMQMEALGLKSTQVASYIVNDSTTGGLAFWTSFNVTGFGNLSKVIPGTVSTSGGQSVITWEIGKVLGAPFNPVQFDTNYNMNSSAVQATEPFASIGCAGGSWAFSVGVNYISGSIASQTANSSSSCTPPPAQAPVNTAVPTIAGGTQVGDQLTASDGTWTGTPTPTFTRQWERCDSSGSNCVAIGGANGTTYTLQAADVGGTVRVVVTATNSAAPSGVTANSAPSGVITNYAQTTGNGPLTVTGTVPLTLSLALSSTSLDLGTFIPGASPLPAPISGALYSTSTVATVTASTTTSQLTIKDPDTAHAGQLQQGSYFLPNAVRASATGSAAGATYSTSTPVGPTTAPTTLVNYGQPVSKDAVTLGFGQLISATTPLHTGSYSKTFTVTLAQTSP